MKVQKIILGMAMITLFSGAITGQAQAAYGAKKSSKTYSFQDMRKTYMAYDKNNVQPKKESLTLREVAKVWNKKYKLIFTQTSDASKKHKDWGRVAFVSPAKNEKCLKLYYYYAKEGKKKGAGPEKTTVKGGVKSASCSAAADYGVSVQYPSKL